MFPKAVRKILYLFISGIAGLYFFNVVRLHTTQEVIAIKQYSRALLDKDTLAARNLVSGKSALEPFNVRKKRDQALRGKIRWVTYRIKEIKRSEKSTSLRVHQVIHLDPPGQDSFWGTAIIVNKLEVTMVSLHSSWKVRSYRDSFYSPGMKD